MDTVLGLYALLSAPAMFFPHRPDAWPVFLAGHLLAALLLLKAPPIRPLLRAARERWPRVSRWVADWYPLLLIPFLYAELAPLNRAVHGGAYFDPLILRLEEAVFGGQPSREWAAALPVRWLSEALHASYLSYYVLIYGPPLLLYARGRRRDFRAMVLAVMLTFAAHYLFFIYLPVQGPRYLFEPPTGGIEDGAVYRLTHRVLEAGSSQGAAFPSSHVAVAVAQTVACWRLAPALVAPVGLLTFGLAAGAVYGGFHYATDALAGAVLGATLAAFALRLRAGSDRGPV